MLKFGREPTFSRDCKFVQIDAEGSAVAQTQAVVGDSRRVALEVVADPEAASRPLLAQSGGFRPQHSGWADEVRDAIAFRPRSWQDLEPDENGALHPVQVCREIQKLLGDGGVFVSDGGEFGQWAQACINAPERLINGPSGAIGSSIPFAIAARLARPQAPIVATLGDGTFGFHAMELDTAVRYGIPFVRSWATTPRGTPSTRYSYATTARTGCSSASCCRRAMTVWPRPSAVTGRMLRRWRSLARCSERPWTAGFQPALTCPSRGIRHRRSGGDDMDGEDRRGLSLIVVIGIGDSRRTPTCVVTRQE